MDKKSQEMFRQRLLASRQALAGEVVNRREEGCSLGTDGIQDAGDDAANAYARQLLLNLGEREREALREIDEALERLEEGSFGVCQECGEEIVEARLQALPYATLCVECKSNQESGVG